MLVYYRLCSEHAGAYRECPLDAPSVTVGELKLILARRCGFAAQFKRKIDFRVFLVTNARGAVASPAAGGGGPQQSGVSGISADVPAGADERLEEVQSEDQVVESYSRVVLQRTVVRPANAALGALSHAAKTELTLTRQDFETLGEQQGPHTALAPSASHADGAAAAASAAESFPAEWICFLCRQLLRQPLLIKCASNCGRSACRLCVEAALKKKRECPFCGGAFRQVIRNKRLEEILKHARPGAGNGGRAEAEDETPVAAQGSFVSASAQQPHHHQQASGVNSNAQPNSAAAVKAEGTGSVAAGAAAASSFKTQGVSGEDASEDVWGLQAAQRDTPQTDGSLEEGGGGRQRLSAEALLKGGPRVSSLLADGARPRGPSLESASSSPRHFLYLYSPHQLQVLRRFDIVVVHAASAMAAALAEAAVKRSAREEAGCGQDGRCEESRERGAASSSASGACSSSSQTLVGTARASLHGAAAATAGASRVRAEAASAALGGDASLSEEFLVLPCCLSGGGSSFSVGGVMRLCLENVLDPSTDRLAAEVAARWQKGAESEEASVVGKGQGFKSEGDERLGAPPAFVLRVNWVEKYGRMPMLPSRKQPLAALFLSLAGRGGSARPSASAGAGLGLSSAGGTNNNLTSLLPVAGVIRRTALGGASLEVAVEAAKYHEALACVRDYGLFGSRSADAWRGGTAAAAASCPLSSAVAAAVASEAPSPNHSSLAATAAGSAALTRVGGAKSVSSAPPQRAAGPRPLGLPGKAPEPLNPFLGYTAVLPFLDEEKFERVKRLQIKALRKAGGLAPLSAILGKRRRRQQKSPPPPAPATTTQESAAADETTQKKKTHEETTEMKKTQAEAVVADSSEPARLGGGGGLVSQEERALRLRDQGHVCKPSSSCEAPSESAPKKGVCPAPKSGPRSLASLSDCRGPPSKQARIPPKVPPLLQRQARAS